MSLFSRNHYFLKELKCLRRRALVVTASLMFNVHWQHISLSCLFHNCTVASTDFFYENHPFPNIKACVFCTVGFWYNPGAQLGTSGLVLNYPLSPRCDNPEPQAYSPSRVRKSSLWHRSQPNPAIGLCTVPGCTSPGTPFLYILLQPSWVGAMATVQARSKIFTIWSFIEKKKSHFPARPAHVLWPWSEPPVCCPVTQDGIITPELSFCPLLLWAF